MLTIAMSGHSMAAERLRSPLTKSRSGLTTRKQSALDAEAISLSDTPDAEPSSEEDLDRHRSGSQSGAVYDGSKTTKTSPFLCRYSWIVHDRVFISDIRGIGFNVVDLALSARHVAHYVGGRTSKDAPRSKACRILAGSRGRAFMTYSVKPFASSSKSTEIRSHPAEVQLGASLGWRRLRGGMSRSAASQLARQQVQPEYFGVTVAEAAQATAVGNTMSLTRPIGMGTVGLTSTSVYALTEHWGLVTRLGLRDSSAQP